MKTVISLCDLTGNMTKDWSDNGYSVLLVDPQHGTTTTTNNVTKFAGTIEDAMTRISELIRDNKVAMVFGFPPCTDLSVSGARWFKNKHEGDNLFQAKAIMVAEQARTIGRLSGAPYMIENPVSVLASAFGKPDHTFHPHDYTQLEPEDNYTKKTCLWTGNGFRMPAPMRNEFLPEPDNRIHFASPGPERANIRSATPRGFAKAVYLLNS